MSKSTPDDLAIAFRSLARRQREALGDADPSAFGDLDAELQRHVADAAAIVGSAPDGDVRRRGDRVTARLGRRPRWPTLQRAALDAGAVLRRLAAAVAESSDGD